MPENRDISEEELREISALYGEADPDDAPIYCDVCDMKLIPHKGQTECPMLLRNQTLEFMRDIMGKKDIPVIEKQILYIFQKCIRSIHMLRIQSAPAYR